MAKLDAVCDFRLDRRERTQAENAGRAFRFWRVKIALRGVPGPSMGADCPPGSIAAHAAAYHR